MVNVISLPYIFQVLYVMCFTSPRYQVSVYRTIGPLVWTFSLFHGFMKSNSQPLEKDKKVHKILAHYLIEACLRTVKITGPA